VPEVEPGLGTVRSAGRPAAELSDEELESQGTQAHGTRNWVFLHGTAEQFSRHTSRMLELEQEYLRRHPHRTWQGSGGAHPSAPGEPPSDPVALVLAQVAARPGGRMHKLEVHQAAREAGLDRTALALLYTAAEPLLVTEQQDRIITAAGRARLGSVAEAGSRP
jgi:hypothetical protein